MENEKFLMLCADGSAEDIRSALKSGANPNAADDNESTALMCAAGKNTSEAVKLLLDAGADVNAADEEGGTALFRAVGRGDTEIMRALLDAGADPDAQDDEGTTPIVCAAYSGYMHRLDAMKILTDSVADLDVRDEDGDTLLINAVRSHKNDVVKFLIENGADVNAEGEFDTALTIAVDSAVERYGRKADPLSPVKPEETLECIKMLIEAGADVNAPGMYGARALDTAVYAMCLPVIKLLLEAGADISLCCDGGKDVIKNIIGRDLQQGERMLKRLEALTD